MLFEEEENEEKDVEFLFEARQCEDNEADERYFMKRLRIEKPKRLGWWTMVLGALVVVERLSLVIGAYVSFLLHAELDRDDFRNWNKLMSSYVSVAAGLLLWETWQLAKVGKNRSKRLEHVTLTAILTGTFAPLLRTMTESYSSDTVFLLAGICGVAHLYLFDYQSHSTISTRLDCSLSLNASFMMCLLLASRLEHSEQVASFLLSCIVLLVVIPETTLRAVTGVFLVVNAFAVLLLCKILLVYKEKNLAKGYLFLVGFILIVCPLVIGWLQTHKNVIRGPWDAADVQEVSDDD